MGKCGFLKISLIETSGDYLSLMHYHTAYRHISICIGPSCLCQRFIHIFFVSRQLLRRHFLAAVFFLFATHLYQPIILHLHYINYPVTEVAGLYICLFLRHKSVKAKYPRKIFLPCRVYSRNPQYVTALPAARLKYDLP